MARSCRRRELSAARRTRCLELIVALTLSACSSDWNIGTLPRERTTSASDLRASAVHDAVYATDGDALYELATDGTFSAPIPFKGCGLEVVEITIDDSGAMFGAGFSANKMAALYRIDPENGRCSILRQFQTSAPWSVGFSTHNTLLADESGDLVVFNTKSGAREDVLVPQCSSGCSPRSGCDIAVHSGSTWISALEDWAGATPTNVLEEIDSDAATVRRFVLPSGVVLEGLATSHDHLWGFTRDGRVLRVDTSGADLALEMIGTRNAPKRFTGAASNIAVTPR